MKNKEEPSAHSQRGTSWVQVDLHYVDDAGPQTRSSPLRPTGGVSVAARAEQLQPAPPVQQADPDKGDATEDDPLMLPPVPKD